jgi:hypothetical protein
MIERIQETNYKDLKRARESLNRLEEMFRSLEWGRMLVSKNQRIDEMMEMCAILICNLLNCKDKENK